MSKRKSSGGGQSSLGYLFGSTSNELDQQDSKVSSPPVCNSGGGQSSLGYLFGSNALSQESSNHKLKLSSPPACVSLPPYGTHDMVENTTEIPIPSQKDDHNSSPKSTCVYHKVDGKNSGDFLIKGRPSTRVTSVPGGDSSIGYLFGDK